MRDVLHLALALCVLAAPRVAVAQELAERVDAYVQPFLSDGHLSGTLLIARGGQVVFERSWGLADREAGRVNDAGTAFLTASVTKPMTVILASQLVDENALNVEDTLSRWLPDFPQSHRITVEQLLNHQSGIAHELTEKGDRTAHRSAADMVALARLRPFQFEPGERTSYSSGGYSVLARVLERSGRAPYAELLERRIFEPAGMQHSRDATRDLKVLDVAPSYVVVPGGLARVTDTDYSYLVGAGSVFSTPRDLYGLVAAVLDSTLGGAARDVLLRSDGMHWNGRTDGYRCFVDYYPLDDVTVIFAGNVLTGALSLLRDAAPKLARGERVETPAPLGVEAVTLDPGTLERFEGAYRLNDDFDIELYVADGILYASEWLLIPTSDTSFFSPSDYGRIDVVLSADGETVERIDWTVGGQTWPCPRVESDGG